MPVSLRQLTLEDADSFRSFRLAALRESPASFGGSAAEEERLPVAEWHTRLGAPGSAVLGYFSYDTLIGTLGYFLSKDDQLPWLWAMYVEPGYRRQGIGWALLTRAVSDLRNEGHPQVYLTVNSASAAAGALYRAFGFAQTRLRRSEPRTSGLVLDIEEMALVL